MAAIPFHGRLNMAFPNLSCQDFSIEIRSNVPTPVETGGTTWGLSTLGFRMVNPWTASFKYNESMIANADGSQWMADGKMVPHDVIFVGMQYGDDAAAVFTNMAVLRKQMYTANEHDIQYVNFGAYNFVTPGFEYYRQYGRIVGLMAPAVPKTRHHIVGPMQLRFRANDPAWYDGAIGNEAITITAGTGQWVSAADTDIESKRITWKISRTGSNITAVTISRISDGASCTITGHTLSNSGDYFFIDVYSGTVTKTISGTTTDITDAFTGDFLSLTTVAVYTITLTPSVNATAVARYLNRVM